MIFRRRDFTQTDGMHTIGDREYYEKLPLPDIGTHEIAFSDFVRYLIGSLRETAALLLPIRYIIATEYLFRKLEGCILWGFSL